MTDDAEPLQRLAAAIEWRIAELGLEYAELARVAGFSIEVLRKMRHGVKARSSTYRKLERGLGWEAGSAQAILAGGGPTLVEGSEPMAPTEVVPSLAGDSVEAARDEATAGAIRSILDGLKPEQRERVWRRLLAELPSASRERLLRLFDYGPAETTEESNKPRVERHTG